jgi:hypothetical protein
MEEAFCLNEEDRVARKKCRRKASLESSDFNLIQNSVAGERYVDVNG